MADDTVDGNTSWWKDAGNFITGAVNTAGQVVGAGNGIIPAAVQAYKQWNDANKYIDMGKTASEQADPFGRYRRGYGDRLQNLYDDPSAIANTPGYKFALNQALDSTQSRLRAQGLSGGSAMQKSLTDEASGMAAQTWDKEANRLAMLSGAQFDPAKAAMMQMEGGKLAVESQNKALDALFTPFRNGGGNTTINNNTGGGSNGGGSGGSGGGGHVTPAQAANAFQRLAAAAGPSGILPGGGTAAALIQKWLTSPGDMTQADLQIMHDAGIDTGVDTGGMDNAPPGYYEPGGAGYTGGSGYSPVNDSTNQIIGTPSQPSGDFSGGYATPYPTVDDTSGFIPGQDFGPPADSIDFDAIDELFPGD